MISHPTGKRLLGQGAHGTVFWYSEEKPVRRDMSFARQKLEEHLHRSEQHASYPLALKIDEYARQSDRSPFVVARMAIDGWELRRLSRQNGAQAFISAMDGIEEVLQKKDALMDIVVCNVADDIGWYNTQLAKAQSLHSKAKSRNAHKIQPIFSVTVSTSTQPFVAQVLDKPAVKETIDGDVCAAFLAAQHLALHQLHMDNTTPTLNAIAAFVLNGSKGSFDERCHSVWKAHAWLVNNPAVMHSIIAARDSVALPTLSHGGGNGENESRAQDEPYVDMLSVFDDVCDTLENEQPAAEKTQRWDSLYTQCLVLEAAQIIEWIQDISRPLGREQDGS